MKTRMKTLALWGIALGLCVGGIAAGVQAEEGKKARLRWILDMQHGPLRTVAIRDGAGAAKYVHYMTMKVTNNTGQNRVWVPQVVAKTDTGKTYYSGGNNWALNAIRKAERNPTLVAIENSANAPGGRLAKGSVVNGVAIFGTVDPLYDRITIEAYGLVDPIAIFRFDVYGEDEIVRDAVYWDKNQAILKRLRAAAADAGGDLPKPTIVYKEVREDRYFEMVYERLGDEFNAQDDKIDFVREGWKARGELKVLRTFGKTDGE